MKKRVIGYIFWDQKFTKDEKILEKIAKKHKIEIIFFNLSKPMSEEEIESKAKKCNIIYNNSAEDFSVEFTKTLETLGKKVIEPSKNYYYIEDKWIFFMKCIKNKIPSPETILLSENISTAKKQLKTFQKWPVILKEIYGTNGDYVDKADDLNQATGIINKFWKKKAEKIPIIAQELIISPCYRVTVINGKIIQLAVKNGKNWKKTGVYLKKAQKFKPDKELKKIINKLTKISQLHIFGVDLLKKDNKWIVLEINSEPAFDFFETEREKIIEQVLKFLIKKSN